jgi:hypothetical protein
MMYKHYYFILISLLLLLLAALSGLLHYYLPAMELKDIIMTDAVIIGPIIAVAITRMLDDERFTKDRKLAIFRSLVKDRSNPLSYDFVNAFNLIHIEFADDKDVIGAWKNLSDSRNSHAPNKEDNDGWQRKFQEWNSKTDKLLFEITKVLGIKVNPLDIQSSYIPIAWGNDQQTNSQIKSLLLELLNNKRAISIKYDTTEPANPQKPSKNFANTDDNKNP